ncbi:hypothetical protein ACFL03_10565, partial [Thermodesulfobacteriota bacterium]
IASFFAIGRRLLDDSQGIITQRSDLYGWKNTENIVYSLQRNPLWRGRTLWQAVLGFDILNES